MDNMKKLAENIVKYSCDTKRGDKVLIDYSNVDDKFIEMLIVEIIENGGIPIVWNREKKIDKYLIKYGNDETYSAMMKYDSFVMDDVDGVILIAGVKNAFEFSDIPEDKLKKFDLIYNHEVHTKLRLTKKWVILRYPTDTFASQSKMSLEEFERYYYNVCCLDYSKMCEAMTGLKRLMESTDKVRIVADGTDLRFSIKGIPAVKCCGERNIPDGEIYTAPNKNSVNGTIKFNVDMVFDGIPLHDLSLKFENGKVIYCSDERFWQKLRSDEGASYIGEFSFGVNPFINKAIGDILFDEKMCRSIHLAMGNSYDDADNGNKSAIHCDLIQSHESGGEIYFDDVLIRKNGDFVEPNLVVLNVENLV